MERADVKVHGGGGRCPFCHDACAADQENIVCNDCLARHHAACWDEAGDRCAGCGGAPARTAESTRALAAARPATKATERPRAQPASLDGLPPAVRARLEADLEPGETVLWVAQPGSLRRVLPTIPAALFAIPWTAFAVFWITGAATATSKAGGPVALFPLFGLPFVLVGLGMFASPLIAWGAAGRACAAVTDRRVLSWEPHGLTGTTLRAWAPGELAGLTRVERADGSGDLVVAEETGRKGRTIQRGLLGIPRVREAERVLREALLP